MKIRFGSGLLALCVALLAGCGSAQDGIHRVTPLPEAAVEGLTPTGTRTPSPSATPLSAPDATSSPVPSATPADPGATPTPLDVVLEEGQARAIAAATDAAYQPTPQARLTFENFPVALTFDEFYSAFDMRRGWIMSDKLVSLDGQGVVMEGYVAPPLKPKLDFFVLTQIPLAMCPFCSTDADWPDRIALVYLPEATIFDNRYPVRVTGRLEVGSSIDAESGMVSLVRLYADTLEVLEG